MRVALEAFAGQQVTLGLYAVGESANVAADVRWGNPVVVREAREQGKSVAHLCAQLVVHGVLHLLGFDHLIDSEAEAMEAMEAVVLSELGIGNPYE